DGRPYPAATWRDAPIVCELRGGWHELQMWRGGRLVYEENFRVRPGEDVVLTAWDPRPPVIPSPIDRPPAVPRLGLEEGHRFVDVPGPVSRRVPVGGYDVH